MASVVVSAGTSAQATGHGNQAKLRYATNGALWWCFAVLSGSQTTLRSYYSSDLVSWTAGATKTLGNSLIDGRNLGVGYKSIGGVDVLSFSLAYEISASSHRATVIRATISGTTITYGTETLMGVQSTQNDPSGFAGPTVAFSTADIHFHHNGFAEVLANDYGGNPNAVRGTSADPTLPSSVADLGGVNNWAQNTGMGALASGNMVTVWENGNAATTYTTIEYSVWNGSSWSVQATSGASPSVAQDKADFASVARTTTDFHVVTRSDADDYVHRRYNGSSWAAGQSIPTQASKAAAGEFMATDGTDCWLFCIDSDAANTVRYIKWTAATPAWGTWVALETGTKVRTFVSGSPVAGNSTIGVIYTEVNGSNYDVVATSLSLGGAPAARVPFNVDRQLVQYRTV